jgi:GTP1/Obg family GTP-binding protein
MYRGEDNMNEQEKQFALTEIAIVKSYTYMMDYDSNSGREVEKQGSLYLKQGFIDGFLAGVAFRMGGGLNES